MTVINAYIRPYQASDRCAVHTIAANTAFFGDPVEIFLDDRQLYCDATYAYYTDVEPQYGWVAVAEGEVAGFLMGCLNTADQPWRWASSILPLLLRRAWARHYHVGRRTRNYAIALAGASLQRVFPHVDLRRYPAHLHANVDRHWRGHGLGRRLLETYLQELRRLRAPGVHLRTTDRNEAACHLYERLGFALLDAHPTQLWQHLRLLDGPVQNRAYGLILDSD